MSRLMLWIAAGIAAVAVTTSASSFLLADPDSGASQNAPHDAKAEALARAAARKAVAAAVAALAKEFEAHANNASAPLRDKCNYFQDNPAPAVTPDVVFSAIGDVDGPTAETCYIRWQLLSALPAKADDQTAPRIGALYADAPGPQPNPSLTQMDKSHLDSQMLRMTADQEGMVNDAWTKHLAEWADGNAPILQYSDTLFSMLPEGLGATTLGLQDGYQRRAAAGVDCSDFLNEVLSQARDWAVSATPAQLQDAANLCAQCSKLYRKNAFPPSVYSSVKWDGNANQLKWQSKPISCLSQDTIEQFQKFLTDQANTANAGGGIQIKSTN